MKISQINNVNFMAGMVQLQRVKAQNIRSLDSIKKVAEDKDIDIFISKNQKSKFLHDEDMYIIMAAKEVPIVTRGFFNIGYNLKHGMSCMIANKKISKEELSVKMYNAVMHAVESLEKKIGSIK